MSASGKMSLRLHPDKCSEELADFCGGRDKVGVTGTASVFNSLGDFLWTPQCLFFGQSSPARSWRPTSFWMRLPAVF